MRRDVRPRKWEALLGATGGGGTGGHEAAGAQHSGRSVRRNQEEEVRPEVPTPDNHLPVRLDLPQPNR